MTLRTRPAPPRRPALAQLINSVGDGAYYVCSALYFTRVVGLSATEVGLGLTVGWAAGAAVASRPADAAAVSASGPEPAATAP
ncbi:hypothetical protein [Streptomyces radiopugnans]|uniref:hypothetical protein n=1 Tax=Streptomyces radiopugnans TaxID=403935 RepID=UPI003F19E2E9